MSNAARALIGVAAIAVVVVLFVVLQDSGSDDDSGSAGTDATTTTQTNADEGDQGEEKPDKPPKPQKPEEPEVPTIEVRGGQPVGGVAELEFDQGDDIVFKVSSDVSDHVHLHGYDVMEDVVAGETVTVSVPATIEGVFEAELEDSVVPIAEITVNPG